MVSQNTKSKLRGIRGWFPELTSLETSCLCFCGFSWSQPAFKLKRAVAGWGSVKTRRVGPVQEQDSVSFSDDQPWSPVVAIRISAGWGEVIPEPLRPAPRFRRDRWEGF